MDLNIITDEDVRRRGPTTYAGQVQEVPQADDYWSKLRKYVPAETIGGYLVLQGIIGQIFGGGGDVVQLRIWLFVAFFVLALLTIVAARNLHGVKRRSQRFLAAVAFSVWVLGQGGPLATFDWWEPGFGVILVVLFGVTAAVYKVPPLP